MRMIIREGYQKLIDEVIEWLLKQPRSLELIYGKEKMDEVIKPHPSFLIIFKTVSE